MGRVEGKIALITGAGSGLGRAAAQALAGEGATIVVTDVNVDGAEETAKLIEDAGGKAWFQRQDVTQEAEWISLIDNILERHSQLDILVNNAGIIIVKSIADMTLDDFRRQNAINVDGVFLGIKHGSAAMQRKGKGSIVNLSSVAGLRGSANTIGYCASKGAVRLMTKAAAKEMQLLGTEIRVNSVHPALISTPMAESIIDQVGGDTEGVGRMAARQSGRYGTPEEVANAILYLASDESGFCTGSELVIDGGQTA
ncbi:MAG: SDR family NAD(P)-dependent oxidoreductase [Alphaproteobacteria bacterium]